MFLYLNIAVSYWALYEYFWVSPFPRGHVVRCQLVYVVAAPLYKPLALSMWASLMAVVQFAFWFRHHEKQPGKKENGNYAGVYPGESPLDDCNLAWFAAFLVMLPYLAWGVVAFVICIPLVLIFFPLPLIVMGLAPAVVTYIPTYLLGNVNERVGGVVMIVPTVALGMVVVPVCCTLTAECVAGGQVAALQMAVRFLEKRVRRTSREDLQLAAANRGARDAHAQSLCRAGSKQNERATLREREREHTTLRWRARCFAPAPGHRRVHRRRLLR